MEFSRGPGPLRHLCQQCILAAPEQARSPLPSTPQHSMLRFVSRASKFVPLSVRAARPVAGRMCTGDAVDVMWRRAASAAGSRSFADLAAVVRNELSEAKVGSRRRDTCSSRASSLARAQSMGQEAPDISVLSELGYTLSTQSRSAKVTLERRASNEVITVEFLCDDLVPMEESETPGLNVVVTVEKQGDVRALCIDGIVTPGVFTPQRIALSMVDEHGQDTYGGPELSELSEEFHAAVVDFLEERGIGERLCTFIAEFCDAKEEKEYGTWLEDAQRFLSE